MKIIEYSKGSITEVENVFKVVESGAQGQPGPAGPQGEDGGIDYGNPIVVIGDSTITPTAGSYYTCDFKNVTLTGTAGEVFKPAEAGETSRIIWGRGAGADVAVAIDTSNLSIGKLFGIGVLNGESRLMYMDSGGDLVKAGGIEIPVEVKAYNSTDQTGLTHATYNTVALDTETYDPAGIFASSVFVPFRAATWALKARASTKPLITETIIRSIPRLTAGGVNDEAFADVSPDAAQVAGTPNRVTGAVDKELAPGVSYGLAIFARTSAGGTWSILGDGETLAASLSGLEVVPW